MTWYAELKRRRWQCINQFDAICWYRQYLYDKWYNSLTDEQKQHLEENKRKQKEQRHEKAHKAMRRLASITATIAGLNDYDKYHGVYNKFGYPNPDYFNNK